MKKFIFLFLFLATGLFAQYPNIDSIYPADIQTNVSTGTIIRWNNFKTYNLSLYGIEISPTWDTLANGSFVNPSEKMTSYKNGKPTENDSSFSTNYYKPKLLKPNSVYFWHVRLENWSSKGKYGPWSKTFRFITNTQTHVPSITEEVNTKLQVYPNPFNPSVNLEMVISDNHKIYIYNSTGQVVKELYLHKGYNKLQVNFNNLPTGTYYIGNKKLLYLK